MTDSSPSVGGRNTASAERPLAQGGAIKVIVLCGEASQLATHLERNAPWIHVEKICSWGRPQALLRFASIVRRCQPDIVHTRSAQDATWGSFFHLRGRAVVRSRHMTIPERVPLHDALRYRFGCRRIIAAAHFIKSDLVARAGVSASRIDVVGEGVDLQFVLG